MINFITGRSGSGKSYETIKRIKTSLSGTDRKKKVLLIVPEQQTVWWETKIAMETSESDILRLEVTNFTRLANSVFRTYGGLAGTKCTDTEKILILYRTLRTLHALNGKDGSPLLSVYSAPKNSSDGTGDDRFIPQLTAVVGELKQDGISPSDLEQAAAQLSAENSGADDSLTRRLSDLSLILGTYNSILNKSFCDKHDILTSLRSCLSIHGADFFRGKDVYVDSFFTLTALQDDIVKLMMRYADNFTMTFMHDTSESENGADIQFAEVDEYFSRMCSEAEAILGSDRENLAIIKLENNMRHADSPELALFEKEMFTFSSGEKAGTHAEDENYRDIIASSLENGEINVITCEDRYEEAEACASAIERIIRKEHCRYSDIAVVGRNMTSRTGITDSALRRHDIPCYLSFRSPVSDTSVIRLITSLFDVISNDWQKKDIVRMLKTGLLPFDNYKCDLFEEYLETWHLCGRKRYESDWGLNPSGNKTDWTEWDSATLDAVNEVRQLIYDAVSSFEHLFDGNDNTAAVTDICSGIVSFALSMGIPSKLDSIASDLASDGYIQDSDSESQLWGKLCSLLDSIVSILGPKESYTSDGVEYSDELRFTASDFRMLFMYTCDSVDIGTIPSSIDEIEIGSSDGVRFNDISHLIIVGASEGEFPANASDIGAFSSDDIKRLRTCGLSIGKDEDLRAAQEYFMFYRTACLAKKSLTIIVPTSDGIPSMPASRIAALIEKLYPDRAGIMKYGDIPSEYRIYSPAAYTNALNNAENSREKFFIRTLPDAEKMNRYSDLMKISSQAEEYISKKRKQKRELEYGNSAEYIRKYLDSYLTHEQLSEKLISVSGENEKIGADILDSLYKDRSRVTMSHSKLSAFMGCPFSYWATYEMKLSPRADGDTAASDIGTFVHDVLEKFFERTQGKKYPLDDETTQKLKDEIISEYLSKLGRKGGSQSDSASDTGRMTYLYNRLSSIMTVILRELMNEFGASGFVPTYFELPVGMHSDTKETITPTAIGIEGGGNAVLTGKIDRVDIFTDEETGKKYLRVADYKTGSHKFSLEYIRNGTDTQLMLYLRSLKNRYSDSDYGGMEYLLLPVKTISAEDSATDEAIAEVIKKSFSRIGALSDESSVEAAWNTAYLPKSSKNFRLSSEDFDKLFDEMALSVGHAVGRLVRGEAEASPNRIAGNAQLPCEYCKLKYLCRRMNGNG